MGILVRHFPPAPIFLPDAFEWAISCHLDRNEGAEKSLLAPISIVNLSNKGEGKVSAFFQC